MNTNSQNMGYNTSSCYEYIPHPSRNTIAYASIHHKPYKFCHKQKLWYAEIVWEILH